MSFPKPPKKKFSTTLYNLFFKRTSTYALAIVLTTVWFERIFDHTVEALYEHYNYGVSRENSITSKFSYTPKY